MAPPQLAKESGTVTLGGVLAALRVKWLIVVLATVLGGLTGTALALTTPRQYVATASVLLRWVGTGSATAHYSNLQYVNSRTQTYAVLAERPAVLQDAITEAGLDLSVNELRNRVEAQSPRESQLVRISGWSRSPQTAAAYANAVADALTEEVSREETRGALSRPTMDAVVAAPATAPPEAAIPRMSLYLAVWSLFGFVAGVAIALIWTFAVARPHSRDADEIPTPPPASRALSAAHLVWAMLLAATIPWRNNVFYEGGADPVVLAKAAISLLALALAAWTFARTPHRHPVPAGPVMLIAGYLAVTAIGGLANQDLSAALVVAVRVGLLTVAICLLAATYGPYYLMRSLVHVLGALALLATLSGLPQYSGRLGGTIPPLNPNALALITGVVCIWLLAKVLAGRDAVWELFAIGACLLVVLLTGSRTGLAALVLAFVVMVFRATAMRARTFLLLALALPGVVYLVLGTDVLRSVLLRGGGAQVATLSNRTIAWEAAFDLNRDGWQTWLGQGLAQKKISVPGQWWETQLLDSSWVSALVQGGYLGLALVVVLTVLTLGFAAFSSRSKGATWLGLAVLTSLGGFLESGLFDGSIQFMVFLVAALGAFSSHARTIEVDRFAVTAAAPRTGQPVLVS